MSTVVAVGCGLGAAVLFASGATLQHRAGTRHESGGVRRSTAATMRTRPWLLGSGITLVGFVLHAVALHAGPLTLVQPLMITTVLFGLPASHLSGGPGAGRVDAVWAVVLVSALGVFLVAADPTPRSSGPADTGWAVAVAAVGGLAVLGCVGAMRHRPGPFAATALGVASGIALAGSAAVLKVVTGEVGHGWSPIFTSWPVYALAGLGACAVALTQFGYRAGPLLASLPVSNAVNPVVSVVIGTTVFDDRFRVGLRAATWESLSLLAVIAATLALSRAAGATPGAARGGTRRTLP